MGSRKIAREQQTCKPFRVRPGEEHADPANRRAKRAQTDVYHGNAVMISDG